MSLIWWMLHIEDSFAPTCPPPTTPPHVLAMNNYFSSRYNQTNFILLPAVKGIGKSLAASASGCDLENIPSSFTSKAVFSQAHPQGGINKNTLKIFLNKCWRSVRMKKCRQLVERFLHGYNTFNLLEKL